MGAILRYLIEQVDVPNYLAYIPLNTLVINISGSFLLAFIATICLKVWTIDSDIRLGITAGLIGAYTTFSTFCKETGLFLLNHDYYLAGVYIFLSVFLGLGTAFLGVAAARKIERLLEHRKLK